MGIAQHNGEGQQWVPTNECGLLSNLHNYHGQYYIPIEDTSVALLSRLRRYYESLYCPESRLYLIRDPFWHIIVPMLMPECFMINPRNPCKILYHLGKYYCAYDRPRWKSTKWLYHGALMPDASLPVQSLEHMRSYSKEFHWMFVQLASGEKIMMRIDRNNIDSVTEND